MDIKEELLFDFGINMPRILVSGNSAIIDNVKKVELMTEEQVVVQNGKKHTALLGRGLVIKSLSDERMLVTGGIYKIEFY